MDAEIPTCHAGVVDRLNRGGWRSLHLVQFGNESEAAIVKRVPIRTDRILGGIPKFAENSRRPGVKLIRLWNEKVAAGLGIVERVDVLPFHQMGRFKWEKLGLDYTLQDIRPPSPEMVETMCQLFCDEGLPAY